MMESKLERKYGAWEYTSKSGLSYTIGEVTEEFNVIIDDFMDVVEMFDFNILVNSQMVEYFYGSLECDDINEIKGYLDYRITRYENFERTVRFHRDFGDDETLYECYIGKEMEVRTEATRISYNEMMKMAKEDRRD